MNAEEKINLYNYQIAITVDTVRDMLIKEYSNGLPDHRMIKRDEIMALALVGIFLVGSKYWGEKLTIELIADYAINYDRTVNAAMRNAGIPNNNGKTLGEKMSLYLEFLQYGVSEKPYELLEKRFANNVLIDKHYKLDAEGVMPFIIHIAHEIISIEPK